MPSILPNYEYDIFISYRHNDNRSGWVNEFVDALKEELAATLKNPVNIYFDKNSHDGLLETHQVDASLKDKLKCIVLMPIISQTYCDNAGFAWSQEFLPFLDIASTDTLGINIKLRNGNVASRILPIQVHDLDTEDKSLLEDKLNGPLRCISFIYREPGVNRPLSPEDSKTDNLEGTSYKNQVNKVANALKEIGVAVLNTETTKHSIAETKSSTSPNKPKSSKKVIALVSFFLIALISIFTFMNWEGSSNEIRDKSIAVLPFTKIGKGEQIDALAFGIHDDLLTKLSKLNDLLVTSRTSVMEYENTRIKLSDIASELGVGYILEGSIQQSNNRFRLNIQLIDGKTDDHLWADIFDLELTTDNIFQIQSSIASSIASELKMNLNNSKSVDQEEPPTKSLEALRLYNQAEILKSAKTHEAIDKLRRALTIDPEFHKARTLLIRGLSLMYKSNIDSVSYKQEAAEELSIIMKRCKNENLKLMSQAHYDYYILGDFKSAKENFLKCDQDNIDVIASLGYIERRLDNWDAYFDFTKKIALKKDPRNGSTLQDYSLSLVMDNKYQQGLEYIERAIELSEQPIYKDLKFNMLVSVTGKVKEAEQFLNSEKDNLNLKQLAMWNYWLDYYKRNFENMLNPTYKVENGLLISNGDYSHLVPLPSELFIAQVYWLMGDKVNALKQVKLNEQYFSKLHSFENCHIEDGGDFYGNEATKHIARGYELLFMDKSEEAVKEAEHAMKIYPINKDGVQGRIIRGLGFRLIAMSGNIDKTLILADEVLGSISWTSAEMLKNDPIFDQYRELDEFKRILAKYE